MNVKLKDAREGLMVSFDIKDGGPNVRPGHYSGVLCDITRIKKAVTDGDTVWGVNMHSLGLDVDAHMTLFRVDGDGDMWVTPDVSGIVLTEPSPEPVETPEWVRIDPERVRQGDRVRLVKRHGRWEDSITFTVAKREDYDWGVTMLKSMAGRIYDAGDDTSDGRVDAAWRRMSGWGMGDVPCTVGFHRAADGTILMFDGVLFHPVTKSDGRTPTGEQWRLTPRGLMEQAERAGWFPFVPVDPDFTYIVPEGKKDEEEDGE